MAQTSPTVRKSPPPPLLIKFVNPVLRRVLQSRLGARIDDLMLLRFQGRRSGRVMVLPLAYHLIDGAILVVTDRPWRFNFVGGAPVMVMHRGQVRRGRAELLQRTPEEVGAAIRAGLDNGEPPRSFGLRIAPGATPSVADLAALDQALIRVDLEG